MAIEVTSFYPDTLDRMVRAVELVKQRLTRASAALRGADIPYAIAGGNAVAAWVTQVDPGAVRNTPDVDIIVRREDFGRVKVALERVGFAYRRAAGLDMFLDGPEGRPRDAVHLLFAGDYIKPDDILPVPAVSEAKLFESNSFLGLDALVQYKLVSHRRKDLTHIQDLIDLGLVDKTWLAKLPPVLAARLKHVLDNPE